MQQYVLKYIHINTGSINLCKVHLAQVLILPMKVSKFSNTDINIRNANPEYNVFKSNYQKYTVTMVFYMPYNYFKSCLRSYVSSINLWYSSKIVKYHKLILENNF